ATGCSRSGTRSGSITPSRRGSPAPRGGGAGGRIAAFYTREDPPTPANRAGRCSPAAGTVSPAHPRTSARGAATLTARFAPPAVAITTASFSQGGGNVGIGFAIPINEAKRLVPELEEHGHVTRGWLGVTVQKPTPAVAESLGVEPNRGALVAQVTPRSPAAKAGLQAGDVITAYDRKALDEHTSLPTLVAPTPIG